MLTKFTKKRDSGFEKQLTNSRRLRTQCEFANATVEIQDRAEALRTSLADAERQTNERLDTWTVSRLLFIVIFSYSLVSFKNKSNAHP